SMHALDFSGGPVYAATSLIHRVRPGPKGGPLIVMLHGLGGDEDAMWIFERALPEAATVISPRAPIKIIPGLPYAEAVESGYSWLRPVPLPQIDRSTFAMAIELLQRFIEVAIETHEVDRRRVILIGFSQGATMSYALSLAMPDRIAGAIALAGFMPEDESGQVLQAAETPATHHVPQGGYLILHGLEDELVSIGWARKARTALESMGAAVEYHEYPVGHKVSPQGLRDIEEWLKRILEL
ncbi:MAG TPA: alpha/beta fold hydrolase, partial [Anaerolineae bacterium]